MMIIKQIRNIKSSRRILKKFGITMGIALGLLGGLFFWRGRTYYSYFLYLSITFLFLGFFIPVALKPIQKIWMALAILMGWVMTRVILAILFFIIVTPIGLILRLFRKEFLQMEVDRSVRSYWIYRESREFKRDEYERQF